MIKFHDIPANEKAADNMVDMMKAMGYEGEEAQRLVDAAAGISISTLRGLDAMIEGAVQDDTDRTVVQQLVLHQLIGSSERAMELNAIGHFFKLLGLRR